MERKGRSEWILGQIAQNYHRKNQEEAAEASRSVREWIASLICEEIEKKVKFPSEEQEKETSALGSPPSLGNQFPCPCHACMPITFHAHGTPSCPCHATPWPSCRACRGMLVLWCFSLSSVGCIPFGRSRALCISLLRACSSFCGGLQQGRTCSPSCSSGTWCRSCSIGSTWSLSRIVCIDLDLG